MSERAIFAFKSRFSAHSSRQGILCLALLWLIVGLPCLGNAAQADPNIKTADLTELPLETLMNMEVPTVYGASKFEQKTTEAPSSISVVSADEIKRYGYRTLA